MNAFKGVGNRVEPRTRKTQVDSIDVRCTGCGVLLAKRVRGALSIERGDLQATFDGEFCASLVCYRPRCRKLNVLRIKELKNEPGGPAG